MEYVSLQGIGKRPAKRVSDIQIGDVIIWNFGYKSTVKGIEVSKTGRTYHLTTISASGKEFRNLYHADRLLAVEGCDKQ